VTELRLAPIRADVARERRRARLELLEPPAHLAGRRGCGCGWPGALLVDDAGAIYCPRCGALDESTTEGEPCA
jgi:hypothetical protein